MIFIINKLLHMIFFKMFNIKGYIQNNKRYIFFSVRLLFLNYIKKSNHVIIFQYLILKNISKVMKDTLIILKRGIVIREERTIQMFEEIKF